MAKNNVANVVADLMWIGSGSCACYSKDLTLKQSPTTWKVAGNAKQWEVVIENGCPCTVLNLELGCAGFRPTVPIDARHCLINNGLPIYLTSFKFTYVADSSNEFTVADFSPAWS